MVFDGIKFNEAWMRTISLDEFLKHEAHTLPVDKLKEVYRLVNGNSKKPKGKAQDGGRGQDIGEGSE